MREKVDLFNVKFDAITMSQATKKILDWSYGEDYTCKYVVTPNVDHIVKLQNNNNFFKAYDCADMVVVDGKPVKLASQMLRKPLPETIPGSDLCPALFDLASKNNISTSVFLLGAKEGVGIEAAKNIRKLWPNINVCGVYSPQFGFNSMSDENETILNMINSAKPDILVIGLGAPKQEIWIYENKNNIQAKVALCLGATIDFLAGSKKRAPKFMRNLGLEWLHRAFSEPKRLLIRYITDAWIFPIILIKEWKKQ